MRKVLDEKIGLYTTIHALLNILKERGDIPYHVLLDAEERIKYRRLATIFCTLRGIVQLHLATAHSAILYSA
jgi:hypothetical protein